MSCAIGVAAAAARGEFGEVADGGEGGGGDDDDCGGVGRSIGASGGVVAVVVVAAAAVERADTIVAECGWQLVRQLVMAPTTTCASSMEAAFPLQFIVKQISLLVTDSAKLSLSLLFFVIQFNSNAKCL